MAPPRFPNCGRRCVLAALAAANRRIHFCISAASSDVQPFGGLWWCSSELVCCVHAGGIRHSCSSLLDDVRKAMSNKETARYPVRNATVIPTSTRLPPPW
ncbi:hypothetical protein PVAP13_7KG141600 [Panicum virgatum]|uniref:Uncharacterized protein n=1 Tax=Panicum virgatum TaxID=38727 RepID=A0A8T0QN93_PANVG|nr:hypothetical protein PVAP13_7KG141600 [Panicum virgatum]